MRVPIRKCWSMLLLSTTVLLSACGGGGGGGDKNSSTPGSSTPSTPTGSSGGTGDMIALTSANRIMMFDSSTLAVSGSAAISGVQSGDNLVGLSVRPGDGAIYALAINGNTGRIYTINAMSGMATKRSDLLPADAMSTFTGLSGNNFGVNFDPVLNMLRVVSDTGQNLRVNVDTGATVADATTTSAETSRTGVSGVAHTNNFIASCSSQVVYIDAVNDKLLSTTDEQGGVLYEVGDLNVDASAANGFQIITGADGSNLALAAFTINGTSQIYTVDLGTGVATLKGGFTGANALGQGEQIKGLATTRNQVGPVQGPGGMLAVTAANTLLSFNAPEKLCTQAQVSGMGTEVVMGMDVRPADGKVYALGSQGGIYTMDPATAKATKVATLQGATLSGDRFGVDFDPVSDTMQVVSNTNQNLSVNVDSGQAATGAPLMIVDPTMNGGTPTPAVGISAAAFTNALVTSGARKLEFNAIGIANAETATAGARVARADGVLQGTSTFFAVNAATQLLTQTVTSTPPSSGGTSATTSTITANSSLSIVSSNNTTLSSSTNVTVLSVDDMDIDAANNTAIVSMTTSSNTSLMATIDLSTGTARVRGTIATSGSVVRAIALNRNPKTTLFGITADNRLITFKATMPESLDTNVQIAGLNAGESVQAMEFRPSNGQLYAVAAGTNNSNPRIVVISLSPRFSAAPTSATVSRSRPLTLSGGGALTFNATDEIGADIDPVIDGLRLVTSANKSYTVNLDTGVATARADFTRQIKSTDSVTLTAAAYSNSEPGTTAATKTSLYAIDTLNDRLVLQNPQNTGRIAIIGNLGVDATDVNGFDIIGPAGSDVGLAALAVGGVSGLYNINLKTGAATRVGALNITGQITGFSAPLSPSAPAANSTVYVSSVASGVNRLTTFNRNAPGTAVRSQTIDGLVSGDIILGIDTRAGSTANQKRLYALGQKAVYLFPVDSSGNLSTASNLTLTATAMLSTPLTGTSYGVDFSPPADAIRVLSTNSNQVVNADTGVVTTVTAQSLQPPTPVAIATSRNFAGLNLPRRLLLLDANTASLNQELTRNSGNLAAIGSTSLPAPPNNFSNVGFDIVGGSDGMSLATVTSGGGTTSSLYTIDQQLGFAVLTGNGSAATPGVIGSASSPALTTPVRSFAIRVQ